jgi:PAS domain S-box-containing protein
VTDADASLSCVPPPELLQAGLLGALLEQIEEGLYLVDRERRIVYWNRGAERISGYLAQEVVGRQCHADLLMHCNADGTLLCGSGCPLVAVMEDGQPRQAEVFLRHRDGHRVPVRVWGRALRDAGGQIVGAVELFQLDVAPGRRPRPPVPESGEAPQSPVAAPRAFGEWKLKQALETLRRFGIPAGWVALELDDEHEWRRRFGPGFLEAALCLIAETVDANLGSRDLLVRWGPTELRALIDHASPGDLEALARRLKVLVGVSTLDWWGDPRRLTVSSAAVMAGEQDTVESLERRVRSQLELARASAGLSSAGQIPPARLRRAPDQTG